MRHIADFCKGFASAASAANISEVVMIIGKVVGSVVSTRKNENLVGSKFMIVEPIPSLKVENRIVAVDNIGAGIGEYVLVVTGSSARYGVGDATAPVDAAIVGIIDDGSNLE